MAVQRRFKRRNGKILSFSPPETLPASPRYEVLKGLSHPGIIAAVDVCPQGRWLAMELVPHCDALDKAVRA